MFEYGLKRPEGSRMRALDADSIGIVHIAMKHLPKPKIALFAQTDSHTSFSHSHRHHHIRSYRI